jgi:hypothetical protein
MDLSPWNSKTYQPDTWTKFLLNLGAHRWRCEYCRLNFASFRVRKEVFTFGRWKRRNPDAVAEKPVARVAPRTPPAKPSGDTNETLQVPPSANNT